MKWFILPLLFTLLGYISVDAQTRGVRTNNLGNIQKSPIVWEGEINCKDTVNECFISRDYGIRAIAIIIGTYYDRYGLRSVDEIITRYGPSGNAHRSNILNYVKFVQRRVNSPVGMPYKVVLSKIVHAIIYFENGYDVVSYEYVYGVIDRLDIEDRLWKL